MLKNNSSSKSEEAYIRLKEAAVEKNQLAKDAVDLENRIQQAKRGG
jgi:hypothetical protein